MSKMGRDINGNPAPIYPPGASQAVAIGAASVQSTALASTTCIVRLVATSDCYVAFGTNPTATAAASMLLTASQPEYLSVAPGSKIAVIQSIAAGTLNITQVAA